MSTTTATLPPSNEFNLRTSAARQIALGAADLVAAAIVVPVIARQIRN